MSRQALGPFLAVLAVACTQVPLDPRSRVVTPRVLGIVAEPPEARPGQLVALHAIVGGASPRTTFRWILCTRPEATTSFTASSSFGTSAADEGCFGDAAVGAIEIGRGRDAFFAVPSDWLQQLERLRAVYGSRLSAATLRRIAQTIGLVVTVSLEVIDPLADAGYGTSQLPLRAIKRVVIVDRPDTNHNPPSPAFELRIATGDAGTGPPSDAGTGVRIRMAAEIGDAEHCVPYPPQEVAIRRGRHMVIAPDIESEAMWLEPYDAYDASGTLQRYEEAAFYSFYSTVGPLNPDRTRSPGSNPSTPAPEGVRNSAWTAPGTAGRVTHWVIVRDGRGGTSGCSFEVDVVP